MYCKNCGAEIGDAKFCPNCGAAQDPRTIYDSDMAREQSQDGYSAPQSVYRQWNNDAVADKYREVFSSPLFLVICILETVAAALSCVPSGGSGSSIRISIGVMPILFTIALWIIFAASRSSGEFKRTGLAMSSGLVKATYIIMWVVIGFLILAAILFMVIGPSIVNSLPDTLEGLIGSSGVSGTITIDGEVYDISDFPMEMVPVVSSISFGVFAVLFIVAAVILVLINIFYYRNLHRFTKSICVSLETGKYDIRKANTSRKWLMVLGIISAIGAVLMIFSGNNIFSALAVCCSAAASIIASILIKQSFAEEMF